MYMHYRKTIFNQVAHLIHINLSAALLIGLIVFVSGIEAAYDSRVRADVVKYCLIQDTVGHLFSRAVNFVNFMNFWNFHEICVTEISRNSIMIRMHIDYNNSGL